MLAMGIFLSVSSGSCYRQNHLTLRDLRKENESEKYLEQAEIDPGQTQSY